MQKNNSLKLQNVGKKYPDKWGAQNITAEFSNGITGLLGPNGAGKSTMMRMLATIQKPTEGNISWNGNDIFQIKKTYRASLGYLPQDFGVYPDLTAVEFLHYIAALKKISRRDAIKKIDFLLSLFNLQHAKNKKLKEYSGGMKQRIGIAQALLNDPKLLVIDEPTVGLDPEERVQFRQYLSEIAYDNMILLSTHIVSDLASVANSIVIMNNGKIITGGTPSSVIKDLSGKVWEANLTDRQSQLILNNDIIIADRTKTLTGFLLRIISDRVPDAAAVPVLPSLEDAYLYHVHLKHETLS